MTQYHVQSSEQIPVGVDQLNGQALAWAVASARGFNPQISQNKVIYRVEGHGSWSPILLDAQECDELQDKYWIGVERPSNGQTTPVWRAIADSRLPKKPHCFYGPVAAIASDRKTAIFRCFVKACVGDYVQVPIDLATESTPPSN